MAGRQACALAAQRAGRRRKVSRSQDEPPYKSGHRPAKLAPPPASSPTIPLVIAYTASASVSLRHDGSSLRHPLRRHGPPCGAGGVLQARCVLPGQRADGGAPRAVRGTAERKGSPELHRGGARRQVCGRPADHRGCREASGPGEMRGPLASGLPVWRYARRPPATATCAAWSPTF